LEKDLRNRQRASVACSSGDHVNLLITLHFEWLCTIGYYINVENRSELFGVTGLSMAKNVPRATAAHHADPKCPSFVTHQAGTLGKHRTVGRGLAFLRQLYVRLVYN
jgi:hypothetical protein